MIMPRTATGRDYTCESDCRKTWTQRRAQGFGPASSMHERAEEHGRSQLGERDNVSS